MIDVNFKMTDTLDRGLGYAESCFETWRVVSGAVFAVSAHVQRLQQGVQAFGWSVSDKMIRDWLRHATKEAARQGDDMLVRLTVSGGDAPWGLMPKAETRLNVWVQMMPAPKRQALHLRRVTWPWVLPEKTAKFTSDYALALRAAQTWKPVMSVGEQALLTHQGHIISSMTANVLIYRQGVWYTPEGAGVLPGVVRGFLLKQGLIQARACPVSWLDDCDAMACINSGVFVQEVAQVNGRCLAAPDALMDIRQVLAARQGVRL